MTYRRLFVFVEGPDDASFFEEILVPELRDGYDHVQVSTYAQEKTEKIEAFLRSVQAMPADLVFVADLNRAPCVTARKQELGRRLPSVDPARMAIVVLEIEGWYLAGLDSESCEELGLPSLRDTDSLTKEGLARMMPRRFDSRVDFLSELLKRFSIPVAEGKNRSFRYFLRRFVRSVTH